MKAGAAGAARGGEGTGNGRAVPRRRGCLGGVLRLAAWTLAAVAVLVATAAAVVRSDWAAERGRRYLEQRLSETLGRDVTAERVEVGLWPLSITVEDLVIPSPDPADPPLARVPEVEVQLDVSGLRQPKVDVRQVFVHGPEIRLVLGDDGGSNLPTLRSGGGGGRTEVTIGSLIVRDGVFHLDERSLPLELDTGPLSARFEGTGRPEEHRFEGRLWAQDVRLLLPGAEPYRGAWSARATVEPGRVEIVELRFSAPEIAARVTGETTWDGSSRRVDLEVDADARAELFNALGWAEEPLTGPLEVEGRFQWLAPVGAGGEWTYTADLRSQRLEAYDMTFADAAAVLTADASGVTVEIARADYAGGRLAGTVTVPAAGGDDGPERTGNGGERPTRVETDLTFDRLTLTRVLADRDLDLGAITGSLSGRAEYEFTTAAPAGGHGRVQVSLTAAQRRPNALPLAGEAELAIRDGVVSTADALITASGQRLTASGSYDLETSRGSFDYLLVSRDLAPLYRALPSSAETTSVGEGGEPEPWRVDAGSGTAEGELILRPEGLVLTAALDLAEVRTPALAFDTVTGGLRVTPEALSDLRLEATRGGGALIATGTLPIGEGAAVPPLDLAFDFAGWPLAELAPLLPEGTPELAGAVSGFLELGGSFEAPAGRAELAAGPLSVSGFELERAEAAGVFGPDRLALDRLVAEVPAGTLTASGSFEPGSGAISGSLEALELDLGAAPFTGLFPGELRGTLALGAAVTGTLDAPEAQLSAAGTGLSLAGRELGEAGTADTTVLWRGGRLTAEGSLLGLLRFDGGGELVLSPRGAEADGRGGTIDLALEIAGEDLRGLAELAAERSLPELGGSFRGTLTVRGDPAVPEELTVELRLPSVEIAYEELEIRNLEPVTATLDGGTARLESLYLGQPGTANELFVAGTAEVGAEGVPIDLDFQGSIDASWLEVAMPGTELAGTISVLGSVRGPASAPRVNGQGEVDGGRAILPGFPHALESIAATVFFEPGGDVILDSLDAGLAGGDVRAQGRISPASSGEVLEYRFQTRVRGFTLRWPEGFVLRGGADLSLSSAGEERLISGVVELDRIFYLQDVTVSLTRLLQEALQRQRVEAGAGDSELASTQLQVAVRGPLRVRNNIADLDGQANLVVRGTLASPAVFGQVTMEPDGTVTYADTVYSIERGLLTFSNPLRIDPVIDVSATAEVDDYDVTLQLSGTLDRLDASFSSDPPLADLEVLQLLATGTAPSTDAGLYPTGSQSDETAGGAAALLYGQAASLVTERVNTLFGFDRFRINPGIGGAVGFAVGKRLSRDFYITVSNDPVNDIDYVVQAEWRVSQQVTLVLTQRGEEAFAVDLRWEKRF